MGHDHRPRLAHDLGVLSAAISRRELIGFLGGAGALALFGCGGGGTDAPDASAADPRCLRIPEETAGPYPGDGTNGKNALALAGIMRSDIRSSIGGATGVAPGVPLTVTLTILNSAGCAPLAGRAVYLWHCDREGDYSMYSPAVANENFLRGVQVTSAEGKVTFTTIFPGCYPGRWPHMHFEIYPDLASATNGTLATVTSQLALPEGICDEVYTTTEYAASAGSLSAVRLTTDSAFSDGADRQMFTITGTDAGYAAALTLGISV